MNEAIDRLFRGILEGTAAEPPEEPVAAPTPKLDISPATVRDIPIDMLVDMEQPFRPYDEAELEGMRKSICSYGVLQRLTVRPWGDQYQIISGRARRTAAKLAGFSVVPCEVKELEDEEAQLQMIEANLQQRIKLLPSEKAWAYRLQMEALGRQGRRTDLTSPQGAARFRSDDELGLTQGVSGDTVHRYIRLTYLLPELLACVDEERLGLTVGEALSFLSQADQGTVFRFFFQEHPAYLSQAMAVAIREAGETGPLTEQLLVQLVEPQEGTPLRSVSLPVKPLKRYFKPGDSRAYIIETVEKALDAYFRSRN